MSIMYSAGKNKKCYNNSQNRRKQNQQQIINSLKSWNVQITPSGLDKPEAVLPTRISSTSVQENPSCILANITRRQNKPEPNKIAGTTEDENSIVAVPINDQEHICTEIEAKGSAMKKKTSQELKNVKTKQKEHCEKKNPNNAEQVSTGLQEDFNGAACRHTAKEVIPDENDGHPHAAQIAVLSSHQHSELPMTANDNDSVKESLQSTISPVISSASRGNYHKNSYSKGSMAGWGPPQRYSNSAQSKDFSTSRLANGSIRTDHRVPNSHNFAVRESHTIYSNQQHSHRHPSYMYQFEQQHGQQLDQNHTAQSSNNGRLHQYSFDLRDIRQQMSIVGSDSGSSMLHSTPPANCNFTQQYQQQFMQHYHSHLLQQQNQHNTGQLSSVQLHHVQQQQQHHPFIHHSTSAFGGEDVSCLLSSHNTNGTVDGSTGGTGAVKDPIYSYNVHGTGDIQSNTINGQSSQNIEQTSYVFNRNGDDQHQQQHQQGVNHHLPVYQSNHQQHHQIYINNYHHDSHYQYHNRTVATMRGNQLNYLSHGGGAVQREEGRRNGKKSWNGHVSKGKIGTGPPNGAKPFNKVQNSGYGYRKNYQHHHHHTTGGGQDQYFDRLSMYQQQQQSLPQQHHKQHHLHRNLVYVRGNDRGAGSSLPPDRGGIDGATENDSECASSTNLVPISSVKNSSLEIGIAPTQANETENCVMKDNLDREGETASCEGANGNETHHEDKLILADEDEFELKELCEVPRSSSSSSMVSIPSTESSAISSIISQTQLLECTNASVHEYDSDSSHSSNFRDALNRYTNYEQMNCVQVYRSSSSTSGISSSATNPHSNEFIASNPSSLRASSAGLSEFVRSHSYHGSHQNLTTYGSARSAGEANSPIGSPVGTLRPVSGTQSVPIFGELFANCNQNHHPVPLNGSHSSTTSFGSSSSLEMALRSSSSSLPASSVPPNDYQSMQSGHPQKRSQSGRTSPTYSQEHHRPLVGCFLGRSKEQGLFGSSSGRKSNHVTPHYGHHTSLPTDFQYTPADRFILRANDIELKIPPDRLSNGSVWDGLSTAIWDKFCGAQQTTNKYLQKMQLWRDLYICIRQGFPKYGLYLVGSTISGFGADNSDVDMCLVSRSGPGYFDLRNEALQNLMLVKNYFMSMTSASFDQFCLIQAKVPILRFQDSKHGIEVDLNYNNCVGIRNTHLLHCYSQMDWRVRPLVLVVKLWAQHHNINDAKSMTISSYSLVLMVIHFLQYGVKPSVLPCLHTMYPDKFAKLIDINSIEMTERIESLKTDNNQTLGELLLHFLEYYKDFDYAHYAISVRTASTIPIEECRLAKSYKNDIHQWKHLCIEGEPFDLTNTARSVFDGEVFEQIKSTIAASWRMLKETKDLNILFGEPLFTPVAATLSITS